MMTLEEQESRKARTYKMLLVFGMISIFMIFAGLSSGFVVSRTRPDWLKDFTLPSAFLISTFAIISSSFTLHFALKAMKVNKRSLTTLLLLVTLFLGISFIFLQFKGFSQVVESGYFFTGSESSITTSFLYIMVLVHVAHLIGGIISLIIVIYNHFKQKYSSSQTLGIELCGMYWHFMDLIWVLLFLFFYFYK
jgi:cytochrome c oxidase subunit 3